MVGETYHQRLDDGRVDFTEVGSEPGYVTVECSVNETGPRIRGDIYVGQVVTPARRVIATIRLDAGS